MRKACLIHLMWCVLVDALDTEFNIVIDGIDILPENFSTIESIEALLKKNGVTE